MEYKTFICDVCSIHKKESNNWLEGYAENGKIIIQPLGTSQNGHVAHLCGIECVMKWVGRCLSN